MIYFLQPVGGGPVKIGHSNNVPRRLKTHILNYGRPLVVLKEAEGGEVAEAELHERFFLYRYGSTEWFYPGPELVAFIGRPDVAVVDTHDGIAAAFAMAREMADHARGVRIDSDLAAKGRYLATEQGISLTELLSGILRPVLEREFRKAGKQLLEGE